MTDPLATIMARVMAEPVRCSGCRRKWAECQGPDHCADENPWPFAPIYHADRDALLRALELALELVEDYRPDCTHDHKCNSLRRGKFQGPCDCGFDELQAIIEGVEDE